MDKKIIIKRLKQLSFCLKLVVGKLFSYFIWGKDVWLISERGHEARDNGYHFFMYLLNSHKEINAFYIISSNSKDYLRFSGCSDRLIEYGSLKHYSYLWKARFLVSTHIMGFAPDMNFANYVNNKIKFTKSKIVVFLQHGITKDFLPSLCGDRVSLDLFCCGAELEYDYIKENFHQPENVVQYTGLCRYDNLNDFKVKRQILIMPTWRIYLEKEDIEESLYFWKWNSILHDRSFIEILEKFNYDVIFYPHYEMQPFLGLFRKEPVNEHIHISGFENDVQELLKESAILITDYSSVYFDMAYMRKPILLYQFDEMEFREKHYARGYFDEANIGVKVSDEKGLVIELKKILEENKQDRKYLDYVDSFFRYRDSNNCKRVFEAILNIKK